MDSFETLVPCVPTTARERFGRNRYFRRWRQQEVAKIVHCGEQSTFSQGPD